MSEFEYLRGPVRWLKLKTATAATNRNLQAVTKKKPEVMVKMTGASKSHAHAATSLHYISRDGKLELETSDGDKLHGKDEVSHLAKNWQEQDSLRSMKRKNARVATALVFSMPPGTSEDGLRKAVKKLAEKEFGGKHNYAFVLHTDTDKPHVHVIVHNSGLDGNNRLHISKDRLQGLREHFRDGLEKEGIEAAASPRQVRGKVQRSEKTAYYRVKERLHKPGLPHHIKAYSKKNDL